MVVLHNKGRMESQLAVLRHDLAKGFVLERKMSLWHFACHNVFVDGNSLFYNASPVHSLVKVDIDRRRVAGRISFQGHSKGLSVTKDHLVVGLSEDTFRDRRAVSKGGLAIIDRHSFSNLVTADLNFSSLPHPIGNVNEVRCLSGGELAQASADKLGAQWPDLKLAENNPVWHRLRQTKIKLLLPLRRVKTYFRRYL
jgi:hypothetical protein